MRCFPTVLKLVVFQFSMNNGNNVRRLVMTSLALAAVAGLMTPAYAQLFTNQPVSETGGDVDFAFVVDNTASMEGAITNVNAGLGAIIAQIIAAQLPGSDLRLGLITFKDDVTIVHALTTDLAAVQASIANIVTASGNEQPEASDMAKQIAIQATDALPDITVDANGNAGTVNGAFNIEWVAGLGTARVIVIITDNPPAGYDDTNDAVDDTHFTDLGAAANVKNIGVLDLFVSHAFSNAAMIPLMQADAAASEGGGGFADAGNAGQDTAQSIIDFLVENLDNICNPPEPTPVGGEFLSIDSTALLIAGMSANMGLIVPIVAGIAGVSAYYIKTRMNKD